jgi:ABC-type branched-subunit amino acid transport system substrate-binding protein
MRILHSLTRWARILPVPALTLAAPALAETGVSADKVGFAQVAALDGPASTLGLGMQTGLRAAFAEVNRAGGIHGREVVLDSFDDGYEPDRSATETRRVIDGNQHIALIGPVGTPTSQATQPLATEAGLPFIAPFTGAGFLRDGALTNVVNVRASYAAETESWIAHLVDGQGMKSIAILYQDGAFGRAGLDG